MASRTFRVIIRNRSSKLVLSNTFTHLCDGGWTGGWEPAGVICFANPGDRPTIFACPNTTGDGALQSESDWAFSGTEGYIKYDVFDPTINVTGARVGMVYVYWNNPFYGTTHCRFASDSSDVTPDCDFSGPGAGSVVPPGGKGAVPFTFVPSWGVVNAPDHGMFPVIGTVDADPQAADFAAGLASFGVGAAVGVGVGGLVAGVGDLAATMGVVDHAWIQIDLIDGAPHGGGSIAGQSAQNPSLSQDKAPTGEWTGHWVGNAVDVDISAASALAAATLHAAPVSVSVKDGTSRPPIAFTVPVDISTHITHPARGAFQEAGAGGGGQVAGRSAAARRVSAGPMAHGAASADMSTVVRLRDMSIARDANGVAYIDGVMYLPHGITLRIYKQFEGATLTGFRLGYQRIGPDGRMATNQMLVRPIRIG